MNPLKPNQQRAKLAVAMIWIVLAVQVTAVISQYFQYKLLAAYKSGERFSQEAITANEARTVRKCPKPSTR